MTKEQAFDRILSHFTVGSIVREVHWGYRDGIPLDDMDHPLSEFIRNEISKPVRNVKK